MVKREITEITIDGIRFKIQEFQWERSIEIQKLVLEKLSPILNVLGLKSDNKNDDDSDNNEKKSLLDKLEIKDLGSSIKECLLSIDNPFEFFKQIFSDTYVIRINQSGQEGQENLNKRDILNDIFHKKTFTAFKLAFEVIKFNELAFMEGLGGIGNIIGSLMSSIQKPNMNINE